MFVWSACIPEKRQFLPVANGLSEPFIILVSIRKYMFLDVKSIRKDNGAVYSVLFFTVWPPRPIIGLKWPFLAKTLVSRHPMELEDPN